MSVAWPCLSAGGEGDARVDQHVPNTTKIIIAQRIASVQDADKILIMENGTITAIGNHDSLLKNNQVYSELYYSQNNAQQKGGEN